MEPKSKGIDSAEERGHGRFTNRVEKDVDVSSVENCWQLELALNAQVFKNGPIAWASLSVEEFQSGIGDRERIGFPATVVLNVEEVRWLRFSGRAQGLE